MAEQSPGGNASEIVDRITQRTPREEKLPEVRLRADTPTLEVNEDTRIRGTLDQLQAGEVGAVALSEPGSKPSAVVIPIERYLELVTRELVAGRGTIASQGRIIPEDSTLAAVHIEPVDPNADWRQH